MQMYRVKFVGGSSDLIEAESAAEAREIAAADFGAAVARVEFVPNSDLDEDEDEDEDFDEDEEGADEEEEKEPEEDEDAAECEE